MAIIVSDTSPIRALQHLGRLDLLHRLFDQIFVPPAVVDELTNPRPRFKPILVSEIPGASIVPPSVTPRPRASLSLGELEAIQLAMDLNAELLIDELLGRRAAEQEGLRVVGVVGVMIRAKQRGHLDAVVSHLLRLRDEQGFFVSEKFLADVRQKTGE